MKQFLIKLMVLGLWLGVTHSQAAQPIIQPAAPITATAPTTVNVTSTVNSILASRKSISLDAGSSGVEIRGCN